MKFNKKYVSCDPVDVAIDRYTRIFFISKFNSGSVLKIA